MLGATKFLHPAITMSIYAHELREDLEQVREAMAKFG